MRVNVALNTELISELDELSISALARLIESIAAELARRDVPPAGQPAPVLDEGEIVQVLAFELKRHRKQKDEVFNPFV